MAAISYSFIKIPVCCGVWWLYSFDLSELEASLVYTSNSRLGTVTEWDPVSKQKPKTKKYLNDPYLLC